MEERWGIKKKEWELMKYDGTKSMMAMTMAAVTTLGGGMEQKGGKQMREPALHSNAISNKGPELWMHTPCNFFKKL